jgi:hypothetical protein
MRGESGECQARARGGARGSGKSSSVHGGEGQLLDVAGRRQPHLLAAAPSSLSLLSSSRCDGPDDKPPDARWDRAGRSARPGTGLIWRVWDGNGTSRPQSACRCGVKNANCLLQHAVGLGMAYPVRPALLLVARPNIG